MKRETGINRHKRKVEKGESPTTRKYGLIQDGRKYDVRVFLLFFCFVLSFFCFVVVFFMLTP